MRAEGFVGCKKCGTEDKKSRAFKALKRRLKEDGGDRCYEKELPFIRAIKARGKGSQKRNGRQTRLSVGGEAMALSRIKKGQKKKCIGSSGSIWRMKRKRQKRNIRCRTGYRKKKGRVREVASCYLPFLSKSRVGESYCSEGLRNVPS